jgi:hypothetical protein
MRGQWPYNRETVDLAPGGDETNSHLRYTDFSPTEATMPKHCGVYRGVIAEHAIIANHSYLIKRDLPKRLRALFEHHRALT